MVIADNVVVVLIVHLLLFLKERLSSSSAAIVALLFYTNSREMSQQKFNTKTQTHAPLATVKISRSVRLRCLMRRRHAPRFFSLLMLDGG